MYPKIYKKIALKMPIIKDVIIERDSLRSELGLAFSSRDLISQGLATALSEQNRIANELALALSEQYRLSGALALAEAEHSQINNALDSALYLRDRIASELDLAVSEQERIANELALNLSARDRMASELALAVSEQDQMANELALALSQLNELARRLSFAESEQVRLESELALVVSERNRAANELADYLPYLEIIKSLIKKIESNYNKTSRFAVEESTIWHDNAYYAEAEDWTWLFWDGNQPFLSLFQKLDLSAVLELACGHGRHSEVLLNNYGDIINELHLMDVLSSNIEYCKRRLGVNKKINYHVNNGISFERIEKESLSAIFCYDAMVHFRRDIVESYMFSAFDVLKKGGRVLLHHSNFTNDPDNAFGANPHARAYMSKDLIRKYALNAGLEILEQRVINWGNIDNLDCLSLFEKPCSD